VSPRHRRVRRCAGSKDVVLPSALGPRAGQKAFTLQSLPGTLLPEPAKPFLASADGFSLHAGISAGADDRKKVERLCRYIARPLPPGVCRSPPKARCATR
jgi:hypothetical protein